jgi:sodium transport system ATP-binding protein
VIAAERLTRRFGATIAVDALSFVAPDGAITGLLGANGAGKSTTLRMLATVLRPDDGRALIDRCDTAIDALGARAGLGVLPAVSGIYRELTARENVRYFGRLQGLKGAALERRLDELFSRLELEDCAARRGRELSHGQRVKVGLARALVHAPRNVVLDEPTNGLDVLAIRSLRELLRELRGAGHCVLFSSHVLSEVSELCDRVVVIARGRVVAEGAPGELARAHGASLESAFLAAVRDRAP